MMMFDLPDSKRVKRHELYSRSPSQNPADHDSDLEARFHSHLSKIYAHDTIRDGLSRTAVLQADGLPIPSHDSRGEDPGEKEVYEFRLFSAPPSKLSNPKSTDNAPQRIVLRSPTPINNEPGFINPRRSDHYYFAGPTSTEKLEQYHTAAVTAEEILKGLAVRWRGAELPWRVTVIKSPHLPALSESLQTTAQPTNNNAPGRRKRSGKTRRIAIRKKHAARSAKELAKKQSQAEREAAEKEKRTRRNREKKVKRKEREKMKKAQEASS